MSDIAVILIVALVVVILWRGPKTLPKLGQALGRGVREAKSEAARIREDEADGGAAPGDRRDEG